jgi:hypothetical protein
MKWKISAGPSEGDTRVKTRFALFPVSIYKDDELYIVWFETYRATEQYQKVSGYYDHNRDELQWKVIKKELLYGEHE